MTDESFKRPIKLASREIEEELKSQIDAILAQSAAMILAKVREAEARLAPLRHYLEAIENPAVRKLRQFSEAGRQSARSRLLVALGAHADGLGRDELDAIIRDDGRLAQSSARKARDVAQKEGLMIRSGDKFVLTKFGRVQYMATWSGSLVAK